MTAQCVARFFQTDGKYLNRVYKEHLSDFEDWDQKDHAAEWVLFAQNMGTHLSIDESMLHNDLFTFLSNKEGHGKRGTLIAAVKGDYHCRSGNATHGYTGRETSCSEGSHDGFLRQHDGHHQAGIPQCGDCH